VQGGGDALEYKGISDCPIFSASKRVPRVWPTNVLTIYWRMYRPMAKYSSPMLGFGFHLVVLNRSRSRLTKCSVIILTKG
jgi:hypothetical protein